MKKVNQSNKKIPEKAWREAREITGSIYRMNAKHSDKYAFDIDKDGNICFGIYLGNMPWELEQLKKMDAYLVMK